MVTYSQDDLKAMPCGVFHCPHFEVLGVMPEVGELVRDFERTYRQHHQDERTGYALDLGLAAMVWDIRVTMLMPNQWPCIPGWHFDMIPRDDYGQQDFSRTVEDLMWLWVSGPPLTLFRYSTGDLVEEREVPAKEWYAFSQADEHTGQMSTEFTWRLFARVCPPTILHAGPPKVWLRRHCQVYLDAGRFKW